MFYNLHLNIQSFRNFKNFALHIGLDFEACAERFGLDVVGEGGEGLVELRMAFHLDGKFGINAILGLEYKLDIPLTLQLDFRPGYGMLFTDEYFYGPDVWNYFDWSLNAGVRYTF